MAQLEVEKINNESHDGIVFRFLTYNPAGEVLAAEAEFLPQFGRALVKFNVAENMAAGLEAVLESIKEEAGISYWKANPHSPLRIDIEAGKFTQELKKVAPDFGFTGPEPAGELGTEGQWERFSTELLPLAV